MQKLGSKSWSNPLITYPEQSKRIIKHFYVKYCRNRWTSQRGKSTLFNRLLERREAIVDSTAGVTRDRHYGKIRLERSRLYGN